MKQKYYFKKCRIEDAGSIADGRHSEPEPTQCDHDMCEEEYNAFNMFLIDVGNGFIFPLFLCDKHANGFRRLIRK